MKTYERVDDATWALIEEVREGYHEGRGLEHIGIGVLFVSDGKRHALTVRGYPAAAMVKKVPPIARALCGMSVALVIDRKSWLELGEEGSPEAHRRRVALIDHELTHIVVALTDDGPKISFRMHDFYQGGFYEVAARHGQDAPEVVHLAAQLVHDERGQIMLPGFEIHLDETSKTELEAMVRAHAAAAREGDDDDG